MASPTFLLAPAGNMTFAGMPSGSAYVSNAYGLVTITNGSVGDELALIQAGCLVLSVVSGTPGNPTVGAIALSNLYALDTVNNFVQGTIAIVFNDMATPTNDGYWVKTGSGIGTGNWTQETFAPPFAISQLGSFGGTPTANLAALNSALSTKGSGASILIDEVIQISAPAVNPGVELFGHQYIWFNSTQTGSLGNTGGRRAQNRVGREYSLQQWGREYLMLGFLRKLHAGQAGTIVLIGDGNTSANVGAALATKLQQALPGWTVNNFGVSGTSQDQWVNATGPFASGQSNASMSMASVMASPPDLIIDCYGGTNDPVVIGTYHTYSTDPVQNFQLAKRAAYNYIHSTSPGSTSIVTCTSSMQNDGVSYGTSQTRDELFNFIVRPYIIEICIDFGTAFFDKNARYPDAFVDFTSSVGANQNTILDNTRVNTQNALTDILADEMFQFIVPFPYRKPLVYFDVVPASGFSLPNSFENMRTRSYVGSGLVIGYGYVTMNSPTTLTAGQVIATIGNSAHFPYDVQWWANLLAFNSSLTFQNIQGKIDQNGNISAFAASTIVTNRVYLDKIWSNI